MKICQKRFFLFFTLICTVIFPVISLDSGTTREIWDLYRKSTAARNEGNYRDGLQFINQALIYVVPSQNKQDFFMVYWEQLLQDYLVNGSGRNQIETHKTLHIIVRNAEIDTVYNTMDGTVSTLNPPYIRRISDEEIEDFKIQTAEIGLAYTVGLELS